MNDFSDSEITRRLRQHYPLFSDLEAYNVVRNARNELSPHHTQALMLCHKALNL